MTAHVELHDTEDPSLPSVADVLGQEQPSSLGNLASAMVKAFAAEGHELLPLDIGQWPEALEGFAQAWCTKVPNPLIPTQSEVDYVIVATFGEWTTELTNAFIAAFAPVRLRHGLPVVHVYSDHPRPPEISFLFETLDAGVLEISAWEVVQDDHPSAEDCPRIAEAGRKILSEVYRVDVPVIDLHWVSIVNQVVLEELRWFTDDPAAAFKASDGYIPVSALTMLGCVAGEAIRQNHIGELRWQDGDGDNWARLATEGGDRHLAVIGDTFKRFELGEARDLWESYQAFYAAEQLLPPAIFDAEELDPLDALPDWEPEPDEDLELSQAVFEKTLAKTGIELSRHPDSPPAGSPLAGHVRAYEADIDGHLYDLFLSTGPWTDELTLSFVRAFGHRALRDWEIGQQPVFVFFSGYALPDLLTYCFIDGPPVGPLEGLIRAETPTPVVPAEPSVIGLLAEWLISALESYTTIGLELTSPSVLPGLEFFVREELRTGLEDEDDEKFEPLALLIAVGMTAGESIRHATRSCSWGDLSQSAPQDTSWPVMTIAGLETRHDWVEKARAIWRGECEGFGWRSSWLDKPEPDDE